MKKFIAVIFVALLTVVSLADTEMVNGVEWSYYLSNGEATISRVATSVSGTITIPLTLGGCSVTKLAMDSFRNCEHLTGIEIPESVTSIGSFAFNGCKALKTITIPVSVTDIGGIYNGCAFMECLSLEAINVAEGNANYSSVDGYLCNKRGDELLAAPGAIVTAVIPEQIRIIGYASFDGCKNLKKVICHDGIEAVIGYAFEDCTVLEEINYPTQLKLKSIPGLAFNGCTSLKHFVIPDGIEEVGGSAFKNCSSLVTIRIPSSVTKISTTNGLVSSPAFESCTALKTVYVDAGDSERVKWLLCDTGVDVDALTFIEPLPDGGPYWETVDGVWYTFSIANGEATIGNDCSYSTSGALAIPTMLGGCPVTTIGDCAFSSYGFLTSVTIPEGVTTIGASAFSGCTSLTSVTIPNSVTSIGYYAFHNCNSLTSITIPEGVTRIDLAAFEGCSSLTRVTIPDSVTTIGRYAFYNCSSLTTITIPDSVTTIGNYAFERCSSLTRVTIPDSVTTIGARAFDGTPFYNNQPDGLVILGKGCLYSYKGACPSSVTIPDGVTTIGDSAFSSCSSLTSVTIPDSVTTIGSSAFSGCSSLKSVTIPDSVTLIGSSAFYNCSSLTSVTIPNSVTAIEASTFSGCSSLTSVAIPDSVTSIDSRAFDNCSSLTSITIPDSVTTIGEYAFRGCSSLTLITMPDSVTLIGSCAFYDCSSLTSITIPSRVTSIGDYAFGGCGNLTVTFEGDCPKNYIGSGVLDVKETIRKGSGYPTVEEALAELGYNFDSSWIGVVSLWENNKWFYSCEGYIYDSVNYRRLPHWVSIGGENGDFEEGEFEYWDGYGYFRVVTEQEIISNIYLRSKIFDSYITYWLSYSDSGYVCPEGTSPVLGDGIAIEGYSENQDAYLSPYSINGSGMRPVCTRRGRSYFKLPSRDELESNMWQYWGRSLSLIYEPFVFICGEQRIAIAPEKQSYVASFNLQNGDAPIHQRVVSDIMDPVNEWVGIKLLSEEDVYDTCNEVLYWDGYGTLSHRHQGGWTYPTGYEFAGWRLKSGSGYWCKVEDGSQEDLVIGAIYSSVDDMCITSDTTFEAVYNPLQYAITYENYPVALGYELPEAYTYNEDCALPEIVDYSFGSELPDGTKTSTFRFDGWTINGEKVNKISAGTIGDVVVKFNSTLLVNFGDTEGPQPMPSFSHDTTVAWKGAAPTPKVMVSVEGRGELVEGQDFTVEYVDNDKVGIAKVIVRGKGDYIGTYTGSFTITKGSIVAEDERKDIFAWSPDNAEFAYDGTEKSIATIIAEDVDEVNVEVTGTTSAVNAGVYTASAKGTIKRFASDDYYNYTYVTAIDSAMTMTIRQRDLSGFSPILSGDVFFYDGAVKCPSVVVTDEGLSVELVKNRDYTVAYANNQKVGEATVTISGCGNYKGTITRQFTILDRLENLPKVNITPASKISSGRTTITIAYAGISGYATEVRYTTDGTEPTSASTKYDKRFSIDVTTDTKVRAAAFLRGVRVSEIAEARYLPSANAVIVKSGVGCGPVTIQVGGVAPWTMDVVELGYDGTPTMRSGKIGNDSSSEMTASFTGDGVFEFSWKTSCECDDEQDFFYDHVECLLDGEVVAQADGETPWTKVVVPVATKGDHTIVWKYVKDDGDDAEYPGEDCAWVDGVKFTFAAYIDFAADEEIVGELPERIVSAAGYEVELPEIGEVKYAKHVFSGWTYGGKVYQPGDLLVVDAQDMVVKPIWTEVLEVAYDLNGGSGNVPVTQQVISGGSVELFGIGEASLAKHAFGGWLLDGEIYSAGSEYRPVGDVTFTAVWVAKTLNAPTIIVASEHDEPTTVVEITSADDEVVIYYTIDGSEPNVTNGTRYEGAFEVAGSVTIKAIATKDDYFDSEIVEATVVSSYTPMSVGFVGGEGVVGTMPSAIETALRREIVLPEIGEARLPKHSFGGWTDGVNVYQPGDKYSIVDEICFSAVWTPKMLSAPVIAVASEYDGEKTTVVITTDDAEVEIRYTLDGSEPNSDDALRYESPFDVVGTTTIKAIALRDDWFDSEVVEKTTVRSWGTLNDALDNQTLVFTTGGNANWLGTTEEAYLGNTSVCSGSITHNQNSWIETKVDGPGTLTYAIKVESEYYEKRGQINIYDGVTNLVDSVESDLIGGDVDWTVKTIEIAGDGEHSIRWVFAKDDVDEEWCGRDRAWLDAIVWTPTSMCPPEIESANEEVRTAFNAWVAHYGVKNPGAANVNAFVLGLAPTATEEEIQQTVEEELSNLDLGKLAEGNISAAVAEIQAKYPNAAVELAPVEGLTTSAHLYKLVIKLK